MKSFLERLAGGRRCFRDLGMGETAALSHSASNSWPRGLSKGMRRGQDSPVNKSLKKQAREPWNERKGFTALHVSIENVLRGKGNNRMQDLTEGCCSECVSRS
jgi:hypothetical protein